MSGEMSLKLVRNTQGFSQKKRPPISPAWIQSRSGNRRGEEPQSQEIAPGVRTRLAHLLDRSLMYAELKASNRFHRVAMPQNRS